MPFTNTWDDTFPPDSQLANLLGQDLRNFRLDTQQRMAAISGLDASKPAFGSDAQPNNWNGILFFATDTGQVYQFNNPSWTNVTSSFILKSAALKNVNQVTNTGNTTNNTIYTATIPGNTMGATGRLRITTIFVLNTDGGAPHTGTLKINFGGTVLGGSNNITYGTYGLGNFLKVVIEGGNTGATNTQDWPCNFIFSQSLGVTQYFNNTTGAVNTTAAVNVTTQFQSGNAADSQTFFSQTVEFI